MVRVLGWAKDHRKTPSEKKMANAVVLLRDEFALLRSMQEGVPIDKYGEAIPWYTYPAIDYLRQLDFSDKYIYEFGSGNSSPF